LHFLIIPYFAKNKTKKETSRSLILNGGAKATTLELLINKYVEKIRTPEMYRIVRIIDFINNKKAA